MWKAKTPGIPDELFERVEDVPITKEEVRAVQISKARLKSGMFMTLVVARVLYQWKPHSKWKNLVACMQ